MYQERTDVVSEEPEAHYTRTAIRQDMPKVKEIVSAILRVYGPRSSFSPKVFKERYLYYQEAIRRDRQSTGAWALVESFGKLSDESAALYNWALELQGGCHHLVFKWQALEQLYDISNDRLAQLA